MSRHRVLPHPDVTVAVARFGDHARAQRMHDWMWRSHIRSWLAPGDDGRLELLVERREERRAVDLLLTLFYGLDVDHIPPESVLDRARSAENALTGAAMGVVATLLLMFVWIVFPVVPFSLVIVAGLLVFVLVAAMPGGEGRARDYRVPSRRR